ncbi:MAG TPA: SagB family peptide dehydrogenase [Ktedonobacteraceae bacterium]|nr:SagB family peptide dehydrogenase [Ktedonobacteraceae bacterium]
MPNSEISISREYIEAVFARATRPMPPLYFEPNWGDQPSRFKTYQAVDRFPFSHVLPDRFASLADVLPRLAAPSGESRGITFAELGTILQFAHGVLSRRVRVTWNRDDRDLAVYHWSSHAYARGTASGGGMYPAEMYWACGPNAALLPGLYHYDSAHHAMERLCIGDMTGRIQKALLEHPAALSTDQFLLISLNFWKNSFKYNSFCYHVVTQDLGALLCSLRLLTLGSGSDLRPFLWYRDEDLNRLLGLDTIDESVFVVVPVPSRVSTTLAASTVKRYSTAPHTLKNHSGEDVTLINKASFQRSKEVVRFPLNVSVHLSSLIDSEPRPDEREACTASCNESDTDGERVPLPPLALEALQSDLLEVFYQRKSSFGGFSSHVPLSRIELATMLHVGALIRNYATDLKPADGTTYFTRLAVFINNVEGIKRGAYAYSQQRHCLHAIHVGDVSSFLQEQYFLQNYNLVETGALLAIVGRPEKMLEVYGNRGYRVLNAEVGMVAQGIYLAATALSFGCGAALGFNNAALNTMLGLDGTDEKTLLYLLTGHERRETARFNCRLI